MAWTDERVELLKKYWSEGLSASQIASKMGGVTRNAVIGKVHRLGLSGRATPTAPVRGCSSDRPVEADIAVATPEYEPYLSEPEFIAPATLNSGDLTTVATLQRNMCKWPIGDPATDEFHFCGRPTGVGVSYCAYHARMAYQPSMRRSEREAEARPVPLPAARRRAAG